jgi:hypothetical protein
MFKWIKELWNGSRKVVSKVRKFIDKYWWVYKLVKDVVSTIEDGEVDKKEKYLVAFGYIQESLENEGVLVKTRVINLLIEIAVLVLSEYAKDE